MSQKLSTAQVSVLRQTADNPGITVRQPWDISILESLLENDLVYCGYPDSDGYSRWTITEAGKESFRAGVVVPCKHPPTRQFCGFANNEEMKEILWVGCCDCGEVREFQSPFDKKGA
jgi:hypothetical protein